MTTTSNLRELFEEALALPAALRASLLEARCPDAALRAEIGRMLAADELDGDLLSSGDATRAAHLIGEAGIAQALQAGCHVGPFELAGVLGEGGSSTVFRAFREVEGVRQDAALKLLARGLYTPEARQQFRREREALARLRHPGIARLIEGGVTDTGLAYIALELVDGVPITHYVRQHCPTMRQRLELFLRVCGPVAAAHRALIVHGDLKPSNVLVTADDEVKLLDFGIAKLLDEEGDAPSVEAPRALTPAYAAPEQFAQDPITTATDVFALGVLLDELIIGQRTQPRAGEGATVAPAMAETVHRRPRGDLEYIASRATAHEPEQRYASAGALAEDIRRHLARQPVLAHPSSHWYRTQKFITRYRAGVATTACFMLAILLALIAALWQAGVARQQAARANAVRDFLVSVFQSAGADLPKDQRPTPTELVQQASMRLLSDDRLSEAERGDLLLVLARVARTIGAYDQAIVLLDRGDPLISRAHGDASTPWWDARVLRAGVLEDQGHDAAVIRLLGPRLASLLARHDAIGIDGLLAVGNAQLHSGHIDEGLRLLADARKHAAMAGLPESELRASIDEASALLDAEHFSAGLARADAALALWKAQGEHASARIVELYESIALGAESAGDIARAEHAYREAVTVGDRFFDKPNPDKAWNVGMYASFLIAQGRLAEAEPYARLGLDLRRKVFGNDDPRTLYAIAAMGKLRYGQARYEEAAGWFGQGVGTCARLALDKLVCPRLVALRGLAWGADGQFARADADISAALEAQRRFDGEDNPNYAYVLEQLASVRMREHRNAEAMAAADRVLAIYRAARGGMIQRELGIRLIRAQALFALGRDDESLQELSIIEPKYAVMFPTGILRFEIAALKARVLAHALHPAQAAASARQALALAGVPVPHDPRIVAELKQLGSGAGHATSP